MRHTVALSDIHLSQFEPSTGLWMRFRQAAYQPDAELIAMLRTLRKRIGTDELTLVLNGDIFDFDAPYLENGVLCYPNSDRTPEISARIITAILRDHQAFISAIGQLVADGGQIVFVSGNHDVEMTIPAVRDVVRTAILRAARATGSTTPEATLSSHILFRAWFYLDRDRLLFEHGHQYDELNCYRTIMHPFVRDRLNIAPTFGSTISRYFATRMGYFNPNVDASYLLSFYGYFRHWLRYYLFSSRSLAVMVVLGFTNVFRELLFRRSSKTFAQRLHNQLLAVAETGTTKRQIQRHLAAGSGPIDEHLNRVVRRLQLDHVTLSTAAVFGAILWLFFASGKLLIGAAIPPTLYVGYLLFLPPKRELDSTWDTVQQKTRAIGEIYHARAVVFGHTHHAVGEWTDDVFYGNSGSWSAAFEDVECTKPLNADHPLIWLSRASDEAPIMGGLYHWMQGDFVPVVVRTNTPS